MDLPRGRFLALFGAYLFIACLLFLLRAGAWGSMVIAYIVLPFCVVSFLVTILLFLPFGEKGKTPISVQPNSFAFLGIATATVLFFFLANAPDGGDFAGSPSLISPLVGQSFADGLSGLAQAMPILFIGTVLGFVIVLKISGTTASD